MPNNKDIQQGRIFVDQVKYTIIFPLHGHTYPLHVSKIKSLNISNSPDGKYAILRINLVTPMSTYQTSETQEIGHIKEL